MVFCKKYQKNRVVQVGITLIIVFGVVSGLLSKPRTTSVGPSELTLQFLIRDAEIGSSISGANVFVIHSYDSEQPPVVGVTDLNGLVSLRIRFNQSGKINKKDDKAGKTGFYYGGWVVVIKSQDHEEFCAFLGNKVLISPDDYKCDKFLDLNYPPPSPIDIHIRRKKREVAHH